MYPMTEAYAARVSIVAFKSLPSKRWLFFSAGLFAVIDRIGNDANLEEHWFDEAYTVIP